MFSTKVYKNYIADSQRQIYFLIISLSTFKKFTKKKHSADIMVKLLALLALASLSLVSAAPTPAEESGTVATVYRTKEEALALMVIPP